MKLKLSTYLTVVVLFVTARIMSSAHAADVILCTVNKGLAYVQNDARGPLLKDGNAYIFSSFAILKSPDSVTAVGVQPPKGVGIGLLPNATGMEFHYQAFFPSQTQLDAMFVSGIYAITMNTAHDGAKVMNLNLSPVAYPNPPEVSNYQEAQVLDPDADFLLTWKPFLGGNIYDVIQITVEDEQQNTVYITPFPGMPGVMDGTRTSASIPRGTLGFGKIYKASLAFVKNVYVDVASYPGSVGGCGYLSSTGFTIKTAHFMPDVEFYGITKGRIFVQTNDSAPVMASGKPFFGGATVDPIASNSVAGAELQLPNGFSKPLVWSPDNELFTISDYFSDKASLDALYGSGNYMLTINTAQDGLQTLNLNMPGDQYPDPIQVSNFSAAQAVNADADFALAWNPIVGATADDRIRFYVFDRQGNTVFSTPNNAPLPGGSTSVTLPHNTLEAGQSYRAFLWYAKVAGGGDNAYPANPSDTSYRARTDFPMACLVKSTMASGPESFYFPLSPTLNYHGFSEWFWPGHDFSSSFNFAGTSRVDEGTGEVSLTWSVTRLKPVTTEPQFLLIATQDSWPPAPYPASGLPVSVDTNSVALVDIWAPAGQKLYYQLVLDGNAYQRSWEIVGAGGWQRHVLPFKDFQPWGGQPLLSFKSFNFRVVLENEQLDFQSEHTEGMIRLRNIGVGNLLSLGPVWTEGTSLLLSARNVTIGNAYQIQSSQDLIADAWTNAQSFVATNRLHTLAFPITNDRHSVFLRLKR